MIQSLIVTYVVLLMVMVTLDIIKGIIYPGSTIIEYIYSNDVYRLNNSIWVGTYAYGRAGP